MRWWRQWRASRERRRRAVYFAARCTDPPPIEWLAWAEELSPDVERARQELEFLTLAMGLIVAERDALDDRTVSEVARAMAPVLAREAATDPVRATQWGQRWRSYGEAMARRGDREPAPQRCARVFLAGVGVVEPDERQLRRAAIAVSEIRDRLNAALRRAFGEARLPADVKPSAVRF